MPAGGFDITADIRTYQNVSTVVVIGGGDLMLHAAHGFREGGMDVVALFSPRHADESLPIAGTPTLSTFEDAGFPSFVIDDMDDWPDEATAACEGAGSLALCFGPAWVFPAHVIELFDAGMINFNGIPIPRYLGGAHYTWQILNDDRSGGCVLQEITSSLDRGPILRRQLFELPPSVRVPHDYFLANHDEGVWFLDTFVRDVLAGTPFEAVPFSEFEQDRLYFPRLMTHDNAWIDWDWEAKAIERFCCAFDSPYPGAGTLIDGREIRLSGVRSVTDAGTAFHSFCAGLVVRRLGTAAWVATRGGLIHVERAAYAEGGDAMKRLKEGRRLHTPHDRLDGARTYRPRITGAVARKRS